LTTLQERIDCQMMDLQKKYMNICMEMKMSHCLTFTQ
jgi:hypothetical protein